jgi:hypothetical protein
VESLALGPLILVLEVLDAGPHTWVQLAGEKPPVAGIPQGLEVAAVVQWVELVLVGD